MGRGERGRRVLRLTHHSEEWLTRALADHDRLALAIKTPADKWELLPAFVKVGARARAGAAPHHPPGGSRADWSISTLRRSTIFST